MVGTPPDAFASAGFAHPTAVPERHYFSAPCPRAAPGEAARRSRVDTPPSADYNAALARPRLRARRGAQVAQLVEHATENRSVGGSIPPLGTTLRLWPDWYQPRACPRLASRAVPASISARVF